MFRHALAALLMSIPLAAASQATARVPRVGILANTIPLGKAIGLALPQSLLVQASRVIE